MLARLPSRTVKSSNASMHHIHIQGRIAKEEKWAFPCCNNQMCSALTDDQTHCSLLHLNSTTDTNKLTDRSTMSNVQCIHGWLRTAFLIRCRGNFQLRRKEARDAWGNMSTATFLQSQIGWSRGVRTTVCACMHACLLLLPSCLHLDN